MCQQTATTARKRRGPRWYKLRSGVAEDVRGRLPWYKHDWVEGWTSGYRILAPAVYIFFCSAIPALAFGEQLVIETDGILSAVHTLTATALAGVLQAVIGGQPLLIVGVAEPIVLIYGYMYNFARDKPDLGPQLFLAWAAWACVWAAVMILALTAAGACRYIHLFTRFSGELFGALIAVLFLQEAISGTASEFRQPTGEGAPTGQARLPEWCLVNGVWSLFLAFGLVLTALLTRQARAWRFGRGWVRSFLADYGVPLMVVAWSGLAYAIAKPSPGGLPRRVQMPNTWDVTTTWTVAGDMGRVPGVYIAGALVPALIITILFYFDHSVSSQLAQTEEFNLKKPSAYNYDFALLGVITAAFGLIGLPPINGVLPQAPMHTRSLATLKQQIVRSALKKTADEHEGESRGAVFDAMIEKGRQLNSLAAGALESLPENARGFNMENGDAGGTSSSSAGPGDVPVETAHKRGDFDAERELDAAMLPVEVKEQRLSGLLQSLLCGACLGITPGIKLIPSAVLWGYFAYMAADSLPGSQFWDRLLLVFTDPRKRYVLLEHGHAPYVETVPFRIIFAFTLLQLVGLGAVYGITKAGIVGVIFPVFIMALVPFRQFIMPRIFKREHLRELDAAPYEEAPPVSPEEAHREACEAGWEPPPESEGGGAAERLSSRELGPEDWDGRRIRRPLQRASVEARRRSSFRGDNKGDNRTQGVNAGALQLEGGQGSGRRLDAAPVSGNGGSGSLPGRRLHNGNSGGGGSGGGSAGNSGSRRDQGVAGGGTAADGATSNGGET